MVKISLRAPYEVRAGKWVQPLTDAEAYLLWAVMGRGALTIADLAEVVWGGKHRWPLFWQNGVAVRLNSLRKKLRPFGWTVTCSGTAAAFNKRYALQAYTGEEVLAA